MSTPKPFTAGSGMASSKPSSSARALSVFRKMRSASSCISRETAKSLNYPGQTKGGSHEPHINRPRTGLADDIGSAAPGDTPTAAFDTWVGSAHFVAFGKGVLTVGIPNAYGRDWLASRLTSTVNRLLTGILDQPVEVQFTVMEEVSDVHKRGHLK